MGITSWDFCHDTFAKSIRYVLAACEGEASGIFMKENYCQSQIRKISAANRKFFVSFGYRCFVNIF